MPEQRWTIYRQERPAGLPDMVFVKGPDTEYVEVVPAVVAERLAEALAVAHKHIANDHLVLAVRKLDSTLSWYEAFSSPVDSQEQGGEDG